MVTSIAGLKETAERLQASAALDRGFSRALWYDILGISKKQYQAFLQGKAGLPKSAIEAMAQFAGVTPEQLVTGAVDFKEIATRFGAGEKDLPERYAIAAFGRRRTTITSLDYIEQRLGWRVRMDTLRRFDLNEAIFSDFMAPINVQFISDAVEHLHHRHGIDTREFFLMGAHSASQNRGTLIGETLSSAASVAEEYEVFLTALIKFFEQNTRYSIVRLSAERCTVDVTSHRFIAEALERKHLGNPHICALKGGILATLPLYLDLEPASVEETHCVHRGDLTCRYEIEFPSAKYFHLPKH